ncbi:MAG: SGNH/GDSL hydrolase family protein [Acidobacteriota bacterium]|nr:SGNH/GDSL hydrolase family protein [Acidobacteriota bacterium]
MTSIATIFALSFLGPVLASAAPAAASSPTGFYLSIGASESVGVQPTALHPRGQVTNEGYTNDVTNMLSSQGVNVNLVELGCPGESTASTISGLDHCYHASDSQLSDAVAFLRAHTNDPGLVTVDLGFNDLRPCIAQEFADPSCVGTQLALVRDNLETILSKLVAAAGPKVTIVGLNHDNPFLADAVNHTHDLNFAADSTSAIDALNTTLSDVYASYAIPVANVASAYANALATPTRLAHVGWVPLDVQRACTWTWMCRSGAYGPNIHPNDTGYAAMARAVVLALPPRFFAAFSSPSS